MIQLPLMVSLQSHEVNEVPKMSVHSFLFCFFFVKRLIRPGVCSENVGLCSAKFRIPGHDGSQVLLVTDQLFMGHVGHGSSQMTHCQF